MNRTFSFILLSLCLFASPACSKKKEAPKPDETPQPEVIAEAPQNSGDAANAEAKPEEPQPALIEDKGVQVPALKGMNPTPIAQIAKLSPEEAEKAVLKPFNAVGELSAELNALRERAEIGDDRAKEQFASEIFKTRTHTDPNYKDAIRYMTTIRDIQDADILSQRGLYEFANAMGDAQKQEAAKVYLKKAAEMGHERTLDMLVKNMAFDMRDFAYNKLKGIYESRAKSGDAKAMYDLARLMEFGSFEESKQIPALLKQASDKNYAPAQLTLAITLMNEAETWDEGYALLHKAAENGSDNAWLNLAHNYAAALFTDSAEEASGMLGTPLNEKNYQAIRDEVEKSGKKEMIIVDAAKKAGGYDEACGLLLGLSAGDAQSPVTLSAREAAVDCIDKFVDAFPSRDACDRAYDQVTYHNEPEADVTAIFSAEQRARFGQSILKCYQKALERGDDFPQEMPFIGYPTSLQLAKLYEGNQLVGIEADPNRELAYLVYAASQPHPIGEVILAQNYEAGKYVPKSAERACFWYGRAAGSHLCTHVCKDPDMNEVGTCVACKDAAAAFEKCKK